MAAPLRCPAWRPRKPQLPACDSAVKQSGRLYQTWRIAWAGRAVRQEPEGELMDRAGRKRGQLGSAAAGTLDAAGAGSAAAPEKTDVPEAGAPLTEDRTDAADAPEAEGAAPGADVTETTGTAGGPPGPRRGLAAFAARPVVTHLAVLAVYLAAGIALTWPRATTRRPAAGRPGRGQLRVGPVVGRAPGRSTWPTRGSPCDGGAGGHPAGLRRPRCRCSAWCSRRSRGLGPASRSGCSRS